MSLYRFLGHIIGEHSWDWNTFILSRKSSDIQIHKHPNTVGISLAVLMDMIKNGCKLILVKIDGQVMLKTDPETWLKKGIKDSLSPDQEPHSFLNLRYFQITNTKVGGLFRIKKAGPEGAESNLEAFVKPVIAA